MTLDRANADRAAVTGGAAQPASSGSSLFAGLPGRSVLITSLAALVLSQLLSANAPANLTSYYTQMQDRPLLMAAAVLAALSLVGLPLGVRRLDLSTRAVAVIAIILAVAAYAGRALLLHGYDLTRDEQMATFDAMILASGHVVQALPTAWQADVGMLNATFMMQASHLIAWSSSYLPLNAALRALAGFAGDPALAGAVLTGLSAFFLWRVARLVWPDDREPAVVALAMLALSGQVLITGMTAYAMPAHLAFNLLWLWLFLVDRRAADAAALAVGFVATGLHQPVFHPLFVAPWLCLLLADRKWARLALFVAGYALISVFWLAWPIWKQTLVAGPLADVGTVGPGFISRLEVLLRENGVAGLPLMAANLLRFLAWQPILLLPLVVAGLTVARSDRRAAALAAGIGLTVLTMLLLLPYQGHGFGYRYLHGLIGSAALLAGFGWQHLAPRHDRLRPLFCRTAAATLLVLLPMQAAIAQRFYAPYAAADGQIRAANVDYVVIGGNDAAFAGDLVINRPDLSNRPLRLLGDMIHDPHALAQRICRPGVTVAMPRNGFFAGIDGLFGASSGEADKRRSNIAPIFEAAGCRVTAL